MNFTNAKTDKIMANLREAANGNHEAVEIAIGEGFIWMAENNKETMTEEIVLERISRIIDISRRAKGFTAYKIAQKIWLKNSRENFKNITLAKLDAAMDKKFPTPAPKRTSPPRPPCFK